MADLTPVSAESTDYPTKLRALRDHLAELLADAPPSVQAPLAKQLREVLGELEKVAPVRTESAVDELATKRKNRRANAGL